MRIALFLQLLSIFHLIQALSLSKMSALHAVSKIRLAVGSLNPVKNNAALLGAQKALKQEIETFGFDVPSGVSDQPMSDSETLLGAIARAKNAYNAFKAAHGTPPDFAVGLEGGVGPSIVCQEDLECFAWIVVYDGHKLGRARTGSFLLPPGTVCLHPLFTS